MYRNEVTRCKIQNQNWDVSHNITFCKAGQGGLQRAPRGLKEAAFGHEHWVGTGTEPIRALGTQLTDHGRVEIGKSLQPGEDLCDQQRGILKKQWEILNVNIIIIINLNIKIVMVNN